MMRLNETRLDPNNHLLRDIGALFICYRSIYKPREEMKEEVD